MANSILDKYGIKEVADVTFYHIGDGGKPDYPVLFLDTLKVSTIEQTASNTSARGGKGNPELIMWDFGKEITVSITDALFSAKSMAIAFGNGHVANAAAVSSTGAGSSYAYMMKTVEWTASSTESAFPSKYVENGISYDVINVKYYKADAAGSSDVVTSPVAGTKYLVTFDRKTKGLPRVIEISANSFPGTYYVTGDTYARSYETGEDQFFQFIIPKAKMQAENTITLEAEGDPSVFNFNLRVLRPESGPMMMLVPYELDGTPSAEASGTLYHNHILFGENEE
jgi:hypothetical protein